MQHAHTSVLIFHEAFWFQHEFRCRVHRHGRGRTHTAAFRVDTPDGRLQECAFDCDGDADTDRTTPAFSLRDFPIFHAMATPSQPLHSRRVGKSFARHASVCMCDSVPVCTASSIRMFPSTCTFLSFINISIENVCENIFCSFSLVKFPSISWRTRCERTRIGN